MKKLVLALISATTLVLGMGAAASAQGYDGPEMVLPSTPVAGGPYEVAYVNCVVGETITFTQSASTPSTVTAVCVASVPGDALGTAVASFSAAPTAPGTYTVTGVGSSSPSQSVTFTIVDTTPVPPTTPGGGLPATGSDGIGTTTSIAIGLLVVGLGLFVVAQVRRRQPSVA